MKLRLIDQISVAGEGVNEDRATMSGAFAWVIDGATDVADERLTPAATDADWIAGTLDATLRAYAAKPGCAFSDLPEHLTANLSDAFAAEAPRQPRTRHEHPSASGLIVKYEAGVLSYISVGDCSLIVQDESYGDVRHCGVAHDDAGDRKLAPIIRAHLDAEADPPDQPNGKPQAPLLSRMRSTLQQMREHMNFDEGYGVFSITPTPEIFIRTGFLSVEPGARILLATDGLMRLVDVFNRYDPEQLIVAAAERGLADLLSELRKLEHFPTKWTPVRRRKCDQTSKLERRSDSVGSKSALESAAPSSGETLRVKPSDDASALLIEVMA